MNKACLVKAHSAGLGSLINNAVLWAHLYPQIHVDWTDCLYGPQTWLSLFEPLPKPEEPYDTVCVYPECADAPTAWLTWRWAADLYRGTSREHPNWRARCHELWLRHFKVRKEISDWVDWFVEEHFSSRVIAVQVRWNGHSGEQVYPHRSQTLEEYAQVITKEFHDSNAGYVYVASSDQRSLDWFKERFPVICHPTARRSQHRDTDFHRAVRQTEQDAIDALAEILLLSRATTLIHPVSNMATVALYANPQLKSVYLP